MELQWDLFTLTVVTQSVRILLNLFRRESWNFIRKKNNMKRFTLRPSFIFKKKRINTPVAPTAIFNTWFVAQQILTVRRPVRHLEFEETAGHHLIQSAQEAAVLLPLYCCCCSDVIHGSPRTLKGCAEMPFTFRLQLNHPRVILAEGEGWLA